MKKLILAPKYRVFLDELRTHWLKLHSGPVSWWHLVRLAIGKSLQIEELPSEDFDSVHGEGGKSELHMEQITGFGTSDDYTDVYRLILSELHSCDLFGDDDLFLLLLRRHCQRGLNEFQLSSHGYSDFYEYLRSELFISGEEIVTGGEVKTEDSALGKALRELSVDATFGEEIIGPRVTRQILQLHTASAYDRLRRSLQQLEFILGQKSISLTESLGEKKVGLDIPKAEKDWTFPEFLPPSEQISGNLPVSPGVDIKGNPFAFDLCDTPHLLVAGTTGSGKSYCLHALILSLLHATTSSSVCFALADPKQVELSTYSSLKNLWKGKIFCSPSDITMMLSELVSEMDERQQVLAELGVSNIAEAAEVGKKFPYLIVVVEELADLLMENDEAANFCIRLAQKSRAVGIHLILATQRPDAETFPGLLRSNIPSRIALTVQKSSESKIILDRIGAEDLLSKGDMLVRLVTGAVTRVHGFNITKKLIEESVLMFNSK